MPKGIFKRTKAHIKKLRKSMRLAQLASYRSPKWRKAIDRNLKLGHGAHWESNSWCKNIVKAQRAAKKKKAWKKSLPPLWKLPRTKKQLEAVRKNVKLAILAARKSGAHLRNLSIARKRQGYALSSKIHMFLFKKLCRFGVSGICIEYPIEGYSLDIANPKKKRDLEVDGYGGPYGHDLPAKQKRDRKRDMVLKSKGWKVLRIEANREEMNRNFGRIVRFLV